MIVAPTPRYDAAGAALLHDRDGALADKRDRHRIGAGAVAPTGVSGHRGH